MFIFIFEAYIRFALIFTWQPQNHDHVMFTHLLSDMKGPAVTVRPKKKFMLPFQLEIFLGR